MKTNSINDSKGCSVCEKGQESYTAFVAGAFSGTEYFQYDYRNECGELFATIAKSLEECRKQRDEWLMKLNIEKWWNQLDFATMEKITLIYYRNFPDDEDGEQFITCCTLRWNQLPYKEKVKYFEKYPDDWSISPAET